MKKNLSKLLALALALTMALSLTACGGGDKPAETPDTDKETTQENTANDVSTDEAEELPDKIDVELHTTYSIKDYCDITFSDPYVSDENATQHGASGVIITVPATVKITSSGKTLRGLIMRAQLLDERGHSVQQSFTEKYDADELEPGKTYQASYSLFLSDKTEPEALYASIIMNMHEFSVPVDLTKIRPAAEEPEVPSEIEIVAGETYIVKDYLDITFGELSHSEYNESGHYTTIELPVTITLNMAETPLYVDLDAKSYEANDGGCNGEFELYYTGEQPSPVGPNELEPGQTYELLIRGPLYCSNQVPPYGHIEIVVQDTTFTTPYDISDIF